MPDLVGNPEDRLPEDRLSNDETQLKRKERKMNKMNMLLFEK